MLIQTNQNNILRTTRVKAMETHQDFPYVVVALYTGEIQLLAVEDDKLTIKKTAKICDCPIRCIAFNLKNSQILVGSDEGVVYFLDSENLSINKAMEAHDDFIRSIAVSEYNKCFLTSSDDNTVKLFDLETTTLKLLYKDFRHYVMEVEFDNADSSIFYTACLDGKVRTFSIYNTNRIGTFYCRPDTKGMKSSTKSSIKNAISSIKTTKSINFKSFSNLSGLNSIDFISKECLATVNDEGFLTIYDKSRKTVINMIKIHNSQINKIKRLGGALFATCSNDGSLKIFDETFKVNGMISSDHKIWDFCFFNNQFIIAGTDEELILSKASSEKKIRKMAGGRIFELRDSELYCMKVEDMVEKQIGTFSEEILDFVVNPTGKLIAALGYSNTVIYSFVGLRKKFEVEQARDFMFTANGFFAVKDETLVEFNEKFEEVEQKEIEGIEKILYVEDNLILVCTTENTLLLEDWEVKQKYAYSEEASIVRDFEGRVYACLIEDGVLSCFDEKENKVNFNFMPNIISLINRNNILYFSTGSSTYYGLMHDNKFLHFQIKYQNDNLLDVYKNKVYSCSPKGPVETFEIDKKFLNFQMQVLKGETPSDTSSFKSKAISFYESLNMLNEALKICSNDNQKFEILLKLKMFDEAFKIAGSPAKFSKLGTNFMQEYKQSNDKKYLTRASECFYQAKDLPNLFLTDTMTDKKYMYEIGILSKSNGQLNLALLAFFSNKDYSKCEEILRGSLFHKMFIENFIKKQ